MKNLNIAAIKLARPRRDAWKVSCRRLDLLPTLLLRKFVKLLVGKFARFLVEKLEKFLLEKLSRLPFV